MHRDHITHRPAINEARARAGLPGLDILEILLLGRHIHQRRIVDDLYSIEDVLRQIRSALSLTSTVHFSSKMTVLRNRTHRDDGYGSMVRDEGALELTVRKPRAELYSPPLHLVQRRVLLPRA